MGIIITDGSGQGPAAKVDSENRLETHATVQTEENYVGVHKAQNYFANTTDTAPLLTSANGNTYNLLFLQNLSATKNLVIEKIFYTTDIALGIVSLVKNMAIGAITNANTHIPVNLNFSSGHAADALCHSWDEVGTAGVTGLTAGTIVNVYVPIIGVLILPIAGSIILGQNDSLTLRFQNDIGGAATEMGAGFRFYFDDLPT